MEPRREVLSMHLKDGSTTRVFQSTNKIVVCSTF